MKLRNCCSSQEFTLLQIKRYLSEQNMRMVYKVMGLVLPKSIRRILTKGGADFSDYFPVESNNNAGPISTKSTLGLIEYTKPATDAQLREDKPPEIPKKNKLGVEQLEAIVSQQKIEFELL